MKRWITVLASCAALLGAGCTAWAQPSGSNRPAFDLAATVARFDSVANAIQGDVAELRASELVNYHRVEGAVVTCMRAHGRPYRKAPYVDSYRDFTIADLGYGNGRAAIADSLTLGARRFEQNKRASLRQHQAGLFDAQVEPADVDVYNRCRAPFNHRSYVDDDPPPGVYELSGFPGLLGPIYRDATVVKAWRGYDRCMKDRHGYDVGNDRSDFLYEGRLSGAPDSPAWRRDLAQWNAVFAADADCRRPAYIATMRLVDKRLDAWLVENRPQLLTIRREWRARVTAAAKLPR